VARKKVPAVVIDDDRATLKGLLRLHDYAPRKESCSTAVLQIKDAALLEAEERLAQLMELVNAVREEIDIKREEFHNSITDAKAEVIVQYGSDALAVETIGLRRKSERRPARRRAA
jgi:hypothetical protein